MIFSLYIYVLICCNFLNFCLFNFEVQGAFKRTKHATDGSYTTNSSTGSRAEEPSQSCTIGQKVAKQKGNKRAPEEDSVEEDVRTKTIRRAYPKTS